jgi:hypothetical protein
MQADGLVMPLRLSRTSRLGVEFMFDTLTAELQLVMKLVGLRDKGRHAKAELPPIGCPISP